MLRPPWGACINHNLQGTKRCKPAHAGFAICGIWAKPRPMTNTIAVLLGLFLVALLGFDYLQYDGANALFLSRKFVELIEWMAFWR
jgi:hypothetical protein